MGLGGLLGNAPIPLEDPIAQPKRASFGKNPDPSEGRCTRSWIDWFTSLTNTVSASSTRVASVDIQDSVSLGATDITDGNIAAGVYRFSYYSSITVAGGTPGALTVTLDWTEEGLARSFTGTGIADVTDTSLSESNTQLIKVDGASPVRYSLTVPLLGPTYTLVVQLERAS